MGNARFEGMVAEAARAQRKAQYELDAEFFIKAKVDEISIWFDSDWLLDEFLVWAGYGRLEHFDTVESDAVYQTYGASELGIPHHSKPFLVRYEFLRVPGADWRIEAMTIRSGSSAIHDRLETGDLVHASWKLPDMVEFLHATDVLGDGCEGVFQAIPNLAVYRNSYGMFSYFGEPGKLPYFKPRVNLRDIQPE